MKIYYVKPGDSLAQIALLKQLSVDDLLARNPHLASEPLQPGMKIALPNRAPQPDHRAPLPPVYPGLDHPGHLPLEQTLPVPPLHGFHHHCVALPQFELEMEAQMGKVRAAAKNRAKPRKKSAARIRSVMDDDQPTEWAPSVPWMNI